MIDKDLSYGQLAKMTGYSPKTLANCITSSRKPSKFLVNTLIDVLNINFNEIRRLANGE